MSTSSWAAVTASTYSVSGRVLREQIVPANRASVRLVVSQSPGQWASTSRPKSSKAARPLIVARKEDTQVTQAQAVETGQILERIPEAWSHKNVLKILRRKSKNPPSTFTSTPSPAIIPTPTGCPATVVRSTRPQTNGDSSKDKYRHLEGYNEEEEGTGDASMLAEAPTPDLRAIMAIIQALVSAVASIQLVSGGPQTGGPRSAQGYQQDPARTYTSGVTPPCNRPQKI